MRGYAALLQDLPIHRKLRVICTGVTSAVLLAVFAAVLVADYLGSARALTRQSQVTAQIVGEQSRAALEFRQQGAAESMLSSLRAEPHIVFAAIHDSSGELFAAYRRADAAELELPAPRPDGARRGEGYLDVTVGIDSAGERIGSFSLRSDPAQLQARLHLELLWMALLLGAALCAVPLLATGLGGSLTRSVIELERAVEAVRTRGDYAARAPARGRDELGRLIDGFNHMLGEIQARDGALVAAREELEARVRERTAELELRNRELEAFSYSVSHDLRAPLRAIDGFGEILLRRCGEQLDETARGYLARMRAGSQRMAQLIEGMLELARISRAPLRVEDVDLGALAQEIAQDLVCGEPERRVEFELAKNLWARGDPQLLRAVLANLLENAWKYTRRCERPRIELGVERREGELVYFVSDNGAGFDMVYAGKLFGIFERLHSESEFEGTGIGLASARRALERHGGRIWAQAAVGQGAAFYFTLSARASESAEGS